MSKTKHLLLTFGTGFAVAAGLVVAIAATPASAQTVQAQVGASASVGGGQGSFHAGAGMQMQMRGRMGSGVVGTVDSVNGTTITLTAKQLPNATTTAATYTVDASNAKVLKNGTSSTVSAIANGDTLMVQGTVSGTNVAATMIMDGMPPGGPGMAGGKGFGHGSSTPWSASSTSPITGNGEPVLGGSVTAVNGTSVTVTNSSNVTYTIDASSAKVVKNGTTTAISDIAVGDNLIVQGTVNGNAVTASSIIDQGVAAQGSAGASAGKPGPGGFGGIFSAIGGFFKHLFGF